MHIGAPAKPIVKVGDHVKTGQLIGEAGGFVSAPIHASISGTVKKVDSMLLSNGGSCMAVTIESDGLNEKDENLKAPELTDFDSFIQAVRDSGIVGLGGLFAGLLSNAGIGLLVLFRSNADLRENLTVVGISYVLSALCGILIGAFV